MAYTLSDAKKVIAYGGWKDTPGLEYAVLVWLNKESGSLSSSNNAGTNNPLNLKDVPGFGSNSHGFAIFPNLDTGLQAAADRVNNSQYYSPIKQAALSGDPAAFLSAIPRTPWDNGFLSGTKTPAGGYGLHYDTTTKTYTGQNTLISLYNQIIGASRTGSNVPGLNAIQDTGVDISPGAFANQAAAVVTDPIVAGLTAVGGQISDTFTWIGFILLGLVLIIGGIILIKPEAASNAAKTAIMFGAK